ncbi:ABC transporter permease [Candidatus Woesearchaeota archaeon]|nr:ABC transporter permease [Candidatus Woesearchaeota archaeon]
MLAPFSWIKNNILRLLSIVYKNIKILLRSKSSALVVIFGPLLIISLIVIAFNNSAIFDIKVGAYSSSFSPLSENIVKQLQSDQYAVAKTADRESCIDGVKKGDYNLCLVFSPDMVIENNKNNVITFYVDYSRVNLVYAVMDNIGSKLSKTTEKLSLDLTQTLVKELDLTKTELAKRISTVSALNSNTNAVNERVGEVSSSLTKIDLDVRYELLGLPELITNLQQARSGATENATAARLDDILVQLSSVDNRSREYVNKVSKARTMLDASVPSIKALSPILKQNQADLADLKESMSRVTKSIESINVTNAENIVTPIRTEIQPIVTQTTQLSKLFPTFLTLVIMFVCIMLASTLVLNEKSTNAYFRNFISPTHDSIFLVGTYLTAMVIVTFQLGIILAVARYTLEKGIISALTTSYIPLFLIATMFVLMGMVIGYIFNSQETATLASLFLVSGSLLFSNTILPLETIPAAIKKLLIWNPFVLSESILKKIFVFGFSLQNIQVYLQNVIIYSAVFLVLAYITLKLYKRKIRR